MSDPKMTHTGTGPLVLPVTNAAGVTITFPDASGYLLSPRDYSDVQAMLADWRATEKCPACHKPTGFRRREGHITVCAQCADEAR